MGSIFELTHNSPQMDLIRGGVGGGPYYIYDPYGDGTYIGDLLLDGGYVEYTSQFIVNGACLMKEVTVYP